LRVHGFNAPTDLGNMTYKTNAEIMTRFLTNNPDLEDEPHTALEDVLYYEMLILTRFLKGTNREQIFNIDSYNWREVQVKDHFRV